MVAAYPFNLQMCTIQEKALLRVKIYIPDTEACYTAVGQPAIYVKCCLQLYTEADYPNPTASHPLCEIPAIHFYFPMLPAAAALQPHIPKGNPEQ